jgi:hypothetical protein
MLDHLNKHHTGNKQDYLTASYRKGILSRRKQRHDEIDKLMNRLEAKLQRPDTLEQASERASKGYKHMTVLEERNPYVFGEDHHEDRNYILAKLNETCTRQGYRCEMENHGLRRGSISIYWDI